MKKRYKKLIRTGIALLVIAAGGYLSNDSLHFPGLEQWVTEANQNVSAYEKTDASFESFDESLVPEYSGQAYAIINHDDPFFLESEMTTEIYVQLSELDSLGRCGIAMMCAGMETLPEGERGSIGSIKPSGWMQAKYPELIDEGPGYLYNRAHLLMWALSGVNDDPRGLITGTRYLNVEGMLPNEEQVLDYIEDTGEHVMYRVTPVFSGDNLVADGVLMEAASVESDGLRFCRYAYNVQPGIEIDYETGESQQVR